MLLRRRFFPLLIAGMVMLAGCSADKNSTAARQVSAQSAIDSGNYLAAISTLEAQCPLNQAGNRVCPDQATAQMLATAYMGASGLDVLTLSRNADTNRTSATGTTNFTTISAGLPTISQTNISYLSGAVGLLQSERIQVVGGKPGETSNVNYSPSTCPAGYTGSDSQINILMQLGIAEAAVAVETVGLALTPVDSSGTPTGTSFDSNGIPTLCNGNCSSSSATATIAAGLTATFPSAPAVINADGTFNTIAGISYADFAARYMMSAFSNLSCAFSLSSNNSVSNTINNLAYSIEHTQCSSVSATAGYQPNLTGNQVVTFVQTCLK